MGKITIERKFWSSSGEIHPMMGLGCELPKGVPQSDTYTIELMQAQLQTWCPLVHTNIAVRRHSMLWWRLENQKSVNSQIRGLSFFS